MNRFKSAILAPLLALAVMGALVVPGASLAASAKERARSHTSVAQVAPAVGWLVVVTIQGSARVAPKLVKVAVKAAKKSDAEEKALKETTKRGYKPKAVRSATQATSRMAPGQKLSYTSKLDPDDGYATMDAFRKAHPGPKGFELHHIVEQNSKLGTAMQKTKAGAKRIHNKGNLIYIPANIHRGCVNSIMSGGLARLEPWQAKKLGVEANRKKAIDNMLFDVPVRQFISNYSLAQAYRFGVLVLDVCGLGPRSSLIYIK